MFSYNDFALPFLSFTCNLIFSHSGNSSIQARRIFFNNDNPICFIHGILFLKQFCQLHLLNYLIALHEFQLLLILIELLQA